MPRTQVAQQTSGAQVPVFQEARVPRPWAIGTHVRSSKHGHDNQVGEVVRAERRVTPPLSPIEYRYLVRWPDRTEIWMWRVELARVPERDKKPLVLRALPGTGIKAIKRRVAALRSSGIEVYVRTGAASRREDLLALGADAVLMQEADALSTLRS